MSDIVERLTERAASYRTGGPSSEHTAFLLEEAASEIARLRGAFLKADRYLALGSVAGARQVILDTIVETRAALTPHQEAR